MTFCDIFARVELEKYLVRTRVPCIEFYLRSVSISEYLACCMIRKDVQDSLLPLKPLFIYGNTRAHKPGEA